MDAPLAPGLPFEMLHRVGDIGLRALDAGLGQRAVEQLPGWADEGMAGAVLGIARLLPNQQQGRGHRAFAEHGLRAGAMERAGAAGSRGVPHLVPMGWRNERPGCPWHRDQGMFGCRHPTQMAPGNVFSSRQAFKNLDYSRWLNPSR